MWSANFCKLDNPVAQKLLYKQLTRLGFQVECANNGQEAVDMWKQHPMDYYKMAFFDHHMPKVSTNGYYKNIRTQANIAFLY